MIQNTNNTALLVFSLSARKEAERKFLFGRKGKSQTSDFFNLLISETQRMAKSSGVDVHWIDENQQKGNTFGERFKNAFQDLFDQGYENVISIGNDCPELTSSHIREAVSRLQKKKLVLGPSTDGGVYLLGLNQSLFNPDSFESLPWQKSILFEAISSWAFKNATALNCLETFTDIDDKNSFLSCVEFSTVCEQFLSYCLQKIRSTNTLFESILDSIFHNNLFSLRAPPISL